MPYTYEFPRPGLAADTVLFGLDDQALQVLLIERANEPFAGCWALPGGFVEMDESIDDAARRELCEETGVDLPAGRLEQLQAFGAVDRDPRGRTVAVAYMGVIKIDEFPARAASDARRLAWFPRTMLPALAFDHAVMVRLAYERLVLKLRDYRLGCEVLPRKFTLRQLQQLYERILGKPLDKRNFRRGILKLGVLVELDEQELGVAHRAARLYRFDKRRYDQLAPRRVSSEE